MKDLQLPEESIKSVQNTLLRFAIIATEEQCVALVTSNQRLFREIKKYRSASDTYTRELLIETLTRQVMGDQWHFPCYGDYDEYANKFFAEFQAALLKAGYQIQY